MTDAVDVQVLYSGGRNHVVRLNNLSDGSGETGVVIVDKSALETAIGKTIVSLTVKKLSWSVRGMTVTLAWDHTTDDVIAQLGEGSGCHDYLKAGGGLKDPGSTGGTGDIIVTTTGHSAGDSYDILMSVRLDT